MDRELRPSEEQRKVNVMFEVNKKIATENTRKTEFTVNRTLASGSQRTEGKQGESLINRQPTQVIDNINCENQPSGTYPLFSIENPKESNRIDKMEKLNETSEKSIKRLKDVMEKSNKKTKNVPNQKCMTNEGTRQFIRNLKPIGKEITKSIQQAPPIIKKKDDAEQVKNQARESIKDVELESTLESSMNESYVQESLLLLSVYEDDSSQESAEECEEHEHQESNASEWFEVPASTFRTLQEKRTQIGLKKDLEKKQGQVLKDMIKQSEKERESWSTQNPKSSRMINRNKNVEKKDQRSDKNNLEPYGNHNNTLKLRMERVLRAQDGLILNRSNLMKLLHNVPQLRVI
ncbi:foldase protein PrsA-like [Ambystoma mexicanum]|uniref:foldase protein PrsA-like n=1 Tax=Ambystoma mexicanum TaxID=8296 RepID=UPI0037E9971D